MLWGLIHSEQEPHKKERKYAWTLCTEAICEEAVMENIMAKNLSQFMKNIKLPTLKLKKKILSKTWMHMWVCQCVCMIFFSLSTTSMLVNLKKKREKIMKIAKSK